VKCVINGSWSLDQQRNSIQFFMNMNLVELVRIEAVEALSSSDATGSTTPVNMLEFKDATGPSKPLVMLTPPPAAPPDDKTIIGEPTEIYVSGAKVTLMRRCMWRPVGRSCEARRADRTSTKENKKLVLTTSEFLPDMEQIKSQSGS